ncbi:hypothetical protein MUP06_01695 [Patescibacteria group bacterium]|nr:hypothetical protein [Patescibacteria group bacterium]
MVERDDGKEKAPPEFSAIAQIYDKIKDIHYIGRINLPVDSCLKDFAINALNPVEGPKFPKLPIKVRIDPSGENVKPNVIINNHDGKEVIYMLKERGVKKLGIKCFSLGAPPQDTRNYGKAVKADFSVFLDVPGIDLDIPFVFTTPSNSN